MLYVGGVFNRAEFFTVGEALTKALASEGCATAGGQIIVNESAFDLVKKYYDYEDIIKKEDKKKPTEYFYKGPKLKKSKYGIKPRSDANAIRENISA